MELEAVISSTDSDNLASSRPDNRQAERHCADAIVFQGNKRISLRHLPLVQPETGDLIIDVLWTGISTGTERLLWASDMPPFPGLSYPLVPGYEAVGIVSDAPGDPDLVGQAVFVPGGHSFQDVASVFGASARRLIVPVERAVVLDRQPCKEDVLLALAATAHHAVVADTPPELIVGHGVLGRLMARITIALGHAPPTVWEIDPNRQEGDGYMVMSSDVDTCSDYRAVCDVSGSVAAIDNIIAHCAKNACLVLAGFYSDRPSFAFPAAFMREMTLKIAAEWTPDDLAAVVALREAGKLSLDGLVTHTRRPEEAETAYRTAFGDPACLKMVLDWRGLHDDAH